MKSKEQILAEFDEQTDRYHGSVDFWDGVAIARDIIEEVLEE